MEDGKRNYDVLGVHPGNIVRVRMFVGDQAIDEDLPLPKIITIEEQVEGAVNKRIEELQNNVSAKDSELTAANPQQVINKKFTMPEDVEAADV